ncbi:3-hydroxyacyl-CoA dehydrogenase [Bosea vaviloviae]|uniref:3-hydroxyacyl-CoA dehydrogenase n=1 Tax=Bosea vaviloviae TaxID=1526658 RepID=A0A0N0MCI6_9HYPH|nr:3-hydroxyacyl-CoA dehydrogenase [Bosea vaviloviae]KPH81208.1 3-hydroxyacyl-CoA dehydrogenase [Bosea vaviloviae]
MTSIAIVGSGLIGRAWATVFASHGCSVALHDVVPGAAEAARAHIGTNLEELAGHGLVENPKGSLARIRVARDLADVLTGADLVQENGPETVAAKQQLFAEMDALCPPSTILASSTSFIMASVFSETLAGRARCLVAHPVNPPHLVPIVELAPAPWTDPAVVERAKAIYEQAGQVPIVLRKEKPGFVLNRLQAVLLAEAFRIVGEGVASAEDVDKTIRDGLGLRWSFMGPFETIELNAPGGIPDYCARYSASLDAMVRSSEGLGNPFDAATVETVMSEWRGAQSPDRVKRLSDWRDTRLAALQAHKRGSQRKPG